MSQIAILRQFKTGLVSFIDELINQFSDEPDLVIIRIFLNDQVPIEDVINHFIANIIHLKPMVVGRDEGFFLNNDVLFEQLGNNNKVSHFKRMWRSSRLDQEDKDIIWKWFESFIYLAEKYIETKLKNETESKTV